MTHGATQQTRSLTLLSTGCLLLAMASAATTLPARAQGRETAPAQPGTPTTVALTAGACPTVKTGDKVTLDWAPAFSDPASVTGISDFELGFARADGVKPGPRQSPLVVLTARRRPHGDNTAITGPSNGFYQITFTVENRGGDPGTYDLVRASAQPTVRDGFTGDTPQMTNSPLQSNFCLELAPSRGRRR